MAQREALRVENALWETIQRGSPAATRELQLSVREAVRNRVNIGHLGDVAALAIYTQRSRQRPVPQVLFYMARGMPTQAQGNLFELLPGGPAMQWTRTPRERSIVRALAARRLRARGGNLDDVDREIQRIEGEAHRFGNRLALGIGRMQDLPWPGPRVRIGALTPMFVPRPRRAVPSTSTTVIPFEPSELAPAQPVSSVLAPTDRSFRPHTVSYWVDRHGRRGRLYRRVMTPDGVEVAVYRPARGGYVAVDALPPGANPTSPAVASRMITANQRLWELEDRTYGTSASGNARAIIQRLRERARARARARQRATPAPLPPPVDLPRDQRVGNGPRIGGSFRNTGRGRRRQNDGRFYRNSSL